MRTWIQKKGWMAVLCALSLGFSLQAENRTCFVSTKGSDAGKGTIKSPFKSLERALRNDARSTTDTLTIYMRGGVYALSQSVRITGERIVIKPYQEEKVSLMGGVSVSNKALRSVKDPTVRARLPEAVREQVRELDMRSLGKSLANITPKGFGRPALPSWSELFINGKAQRLSRWPNDTTVLIGKIHCTGDIPRNKKTGIGDPVFEYLEERPSTWKNVKNAWIAGYFAYGYADDMIPLKALDKEQRTLTGAVPTMYGFMSGKSFQRWYALNLLEEIDQPGEYVLDKENEKIYYLPSEDPIETVHVSLLEDPMIYVEGAKDVLIQGITFEYSRGMGVYMEQSENVRVDRCVFHNLGYVAVSIGRGDLPKQAIYQASHDADCSDPNGKSGVIGSLSARIYADRLFNRAAGTHNGVSNSLIYEVGSGGVSLGGGDRKSLTPAHNYVENCRIYNFNRIEKSYRPGISVDGVGNRVTKCEIFNAPSMAILMTGNDHLIEYTDIHHVCQEVDDQGALYYGRDPSERGIKVRYCYFHHLDSKHRVSATYHDDGACGMEVFGCVYYKAGTLPVLIGGGHDHIYKNNIFVDMPLAFHIDNRMQNWSKFSIEKGGIFEERLQAIRYNESPYKDAYPLLAHYWEGDPSFPRNNTIEGNLFYKIDKLLVGSLRYANWLNNYIAAENPGFIEEEDLLKGFRQEAEVFQKIDHFLPIPFEKIGCDL